MRRFAAVSVYTVGLLMLIATAGVSASSFVAFESGQVRPMAMSPAGDRLFIANTPDNRLEIFAITAAGLAATGSVPVGMEPVAVAARNATEVWVVNHLSDSISIVDVNSDPPRVIRTLLVGDEPRDIVFAGTDGERAFITTAHRGQNGPYTDPNNPGELTTAGVGRADVWVFDATTLGGSLGGEPLTIVTLFGDAPRPLAVSPDGSTVYAGIFHSGNQTTTISEGAVCDGGAGAVPCSVSGVTAPGGLPAPNVDANGQPQPEAGLIVKFDGANWKDELGRNWDDLVRFNLPDNDVFAIDANADPPVESAVYTGVGTVLYNMAVSPTSGKLFVANTEAINEVRFEGNRTLPSMASSVIGHQHETRITVIDPAAPNGSVTPRHLNKHINYAVTPAPAGTAEKSLALPRQLAISANGQILYVAAKGSDKVGIFGVAELENGTFVPDGADHVHVSGGGPAGLLLDEARGRLYVTTRFDNGVSIIDTASKQETNHLQLASPEPQSIRAGRRFLYDANMTSSNGEAACASCHVDGDVDSLAWDLGNPDDSILNNPLDFTLGPFPAPPTVYEDFHPMKGPMTTQTLRGMDGHGSMHWRGDRTFGNDEANGQPDNGSYNEFEAFKKFAGAFESLLGRATAATTAEIEAFASFILGVLPPPNPIRNLDDSATFMQQAGETFYFNNIVDTLTCNACHVLDRSQGFFGTDGRASFEGEPQHMKIPHLRNMYSKVGMFGMPDVAFFNTGNNAHQGDQIRGFGFLHDGSTDSLLRFLNASLFNFPGGDPQRQQVEQFLFAFDANLKPVVGQQITLTDSNATSVGPRITLLINQALAGDADLVVKGVVNGEARGWHRNALGLFESDKAGEDALSDAALRALAQVPGQTLTYTAVPPGSGVRIGIDRDEDAVLDSDDNCPATFNLLQEDIDSDGVGNACDNCVNAANNPDAGGNFQLDTDGDGYGNMCDADIASLPQGDGFVDFTDLTQFNSAFFTADADADLDGTGFVDFSDLTLFQGLFFQAPGPSCCGTALP